MSTWILVTDGASARLFATERRHDDWKLLKEFEHPEGARPSREIRPSSAPGRMQQGQSAGGHHTAFQSRNTPREASNERFAEDLAKYLEHARATRGFDQLVLVAEPHWAGVLQAALGGRIAKSLQAVIHKDLVSLDTAELRSRLIDEVFPQQETA